MRKNKENGRPVLVVDLGGTKIITAIVSREGEILARNYSPTLAGEGLQKVIERVYSGIDNILTESNSSISQLSAISIAAAGLIDIKKGMITESPNLPGWHNIPLKRLVEEKYKITTFLINDADAAVLGEHRFGVGRGLKNLVLLTLGTGVGGGLILNGKLYIGPVSSTAEIGHMIVEINGPKCRCGSNGCLETLASGTAIVEDAMRLISRGGKSSLNRMVKGKITDITAEMVCTAAVGGDSLALYVINKASYYLGIALVNLVNIFNPEMIIIGGGVAQMGELLLESARHIVKDKAFPLLAKSVQIVTAQLGNDAGVYGAAIFAMGK